MTQTSATQQSSEQAADKTAVRPFQVNVPEAELTDLQRRINATKWPEQEIVSDASQGVQLATIQKLARYWAKDYDWRKVEARLNSLPNYVTEIDGLEIHFIHVCSKRDDALPLIVTHGWPGSIIEQLKINAYQSMFLVYDRGVVVIDAPPGYAAHIPHAIAEVSDKPITHIIYSHSHIDHIGGAKALGGHPVIIAQEETLRLLMRAADPNRPLPTVTFSDKYTLRVGNQVLELSYHGNAHEPGNIFIYAPAQRVLMVVDIVFPGWMPWRRFALAQDIPGYFAQVEEIRKMDWDTFVGGHVARTGTHADVDVQAEFNRDVKQAAARALETTKPGEGLNPLDKANPWAGFDNYIDRVAAQCVNTLTPKWSSRLAAFDVYIWDQCYAMEQSLRIE